MLGFSKINRIEGTVAQLSQHEIARGGVYYDFVTVDASDGQSYKIKKLICGSDVNQDLDVGKHVVLHVQSFRHLLTGFMKKNLLVATETDRGISMGLRLSTQLMMLFSTVFIFAFFSAIYLFIMSMAVFTKFHGQGSMQGFWRAWTIGTIPLWPLVHVLVVMIAIVATSNILRFKLLGVGRTQTLRSGQVLREI